ncbi:hypothetical protein Tco_1021793, partial [Tanacetum coccineum]
AVKPQAAATNSVVEAFTEFKHLLLPITDRNPYLSEGTRQVLGYEDWRGAVTDINEDGFSPYCYHFAAYQNFGVLQMVPEPSVMDVPLLLDHEFDFFAVEPMPGLAEAPDNQNRWIKWDVPLGGEMDEPMENLRFDDEEELNEFMDDDQDVGDEEIKEWLMTPVTPSRATVTVPSTYELGGLSTATPVGHPLTTMTSGVATQPQGIDDLCDRMSNLEFRHRELVKKMVIVRNAEVTDRIAIGEIHPQVTTLEGQVQTLQTSLHGVWLQNQQLQTRLSDMEKREGTWIAYIPCMEEHLAEEPRCVGKQFQYHQPSSSTIPVPSTSLPLVQFPPPITAPIPASIPTPIPETDPEPMEHTFEKPSAAHQHFSPLQEHAKGQMTVDDLL